MSKHGKEDTVTRDKNGDVTNMSGTITEVSKKTDGKHTRK